MGRNKKKPPRQAKSKVSKTPNGKSASTDRDIKKEKEEELFTQLCHTKKVKGKRAEGATGNHVRMCNDNKTPQPYTTHTHKAAPTSERTNRVLCKGRGQIGCVCESEKEKKRQSSALNMTNRVRAPPMSTSCPQRSKIAAHPHLPPPPFHPSHSHYPTVPEPAWLGRGWRRGRRRERRRKGGSMR